MSNPNLLEQKLNSQIENVFLITIDRMPKKGKLAVYIDDVSGGQTLMNFDILEQALFERLMLPNPKNFLIPSDSDDTDITIKVTETKVITYLYASFCRNERFLNPNDSVNTENAKKIRGLIMRNVGTAIKQPVIFDGQNLSEQMLNIFKDMDDDVDVKAKFTTELVKELLNDGAEGKQNLVAFFFPILIQIHGALRKSALGAMEVWIIPTLSVFVSDKTNPEMAELLLDFATPTENADGVRYSDSLFGQLLSISIMPKSHAGQYEFFDNLQSVNLQSFQSLSANLWDHLNNLHNQIHGLFKSFLLIGGAPKDKLLQWIGNSLHANISRGQIWNSHSMAGVPLNSAPDSFLIGLASVLLRLCKPLFKPGFKVLLVDPTYCAVPADKKKEKGVHLKDIEKDTCLLPTNEGVERLTASSYNFITDCFFMTHKAIDLGYRVCIEKLIRMNRELHQLQNAYQDTITQGGSEVATNIMNMLSSKTQAFLSLQNLILEPNNDQYLMQLYEATSVWLLQVVNKPDSYYTPDGTNFAPQTATKIPQLPAPDVAPLILNSVPEYILENIVGYMTFTHNYDQQQFMKMRIDSEAQSAIFTMILTFMGSAKRVRNPHVRARLAEGLESLLPNENKTMGFMSGDDLFTQHPHRLAIIENLLSVFVGIEMTGQSVQFEQKFNYRRPMYIIMDYLWKIPEQRQCFKLLEKQAVKNIEAVEPPLFLRFVNLLMNDATYLLDESLNNLRQIRELQAAQDSGAWENLPQNERRQNLENLQQLGMLAKFDNILGRDTCKILKLLTSETKGIFVHNSMVDRIAAMLNYVLLHLVGPKKGEFKVKDKKEYEFDPAHTVKEICCIYMNLQDCDEFCLAVANDGRSYSHELFQYAEEVLIRIGGGNLIGEIGDFAKKVQRLEEQQKENDIAFADPPDEFLDPIMSTLMLDPVLLPSSKINIDRSTITRHLLSDQIDPFNRAPLTMDQVIPNTELKQQIEEWIKERREAYKKSKET